MADKLLEAKKAYVIEKVKDSQREGEPHEGHADGKDSQAWKDALGAMDEVVKTAEEAMPPKDVVQALKDATTALKVQNDPKSPLNAAKEAYIKMKTKELQQEGGPHEGHADKGVRPDALKAANEVIEEAKEAMKDPVQALRDATRKIKDDMTITPEMARAQKDYLKAEVERSRMRGQPHEGHAEGAALPDAKTEMRKVIEEAKEAMKDPVQALKDETVRIKAEIQNKKDPKTTKIEDAAQQYFAQMQNGSGLAPKDADAKTAGIKNANLATPSGRNLNA